MAIAKTEAEARRNRDALADPEQALAYVRRKLTGAPEDGYTAFVLQAIRALVAEVERLRAQVDQYEQHAAVSANNIVPSFLAGLAQRSP